MSFLNSDSALASAIASSIARRVPEPIEKCAVRCASPISTTLPRDQWRLRTLGKLRQTDLLDTRRWPCSASAKTRSQYWSVCASSMRSNPARAQVAASHSNTKVLIEGECR